MNPGTEDRIENAYTRPNAYMLHKIGLVIAVVGVQTTNVHHDSPADAAALVAAGKVAFVRADALRAVGAAIAEHMNDAALAAAAGRSTAGGYVEDDPPATQRITPEDWQVLRPVEPDTERRRRKVPPVNLGEVYGAIFGNAPAAVSE